MMRITATTYGLQNRCLGFQGKKAAPKAKAVDPDSPEGQAQAVIEFWKSEGVFAEVVIPARESYPQGTWVDLLRLLALEMVDESQPDQPKLYDPNNPPKKVTRNNRSKTEEGRRAQDAFRGPDPKRLSPQAQPSESSQLVHKQTGEKPELDEYKVKRRGVPKGYWKFRVEQQFGDGKDDIRRGLLDALIQNRIAREDNDASPPSIFLTEKGCAFFTALFFAKSPVFKLSGENSAQPAPSANGNAALILNSSASANGANHSPSEKNGLVSNGRAHSRSKKPPKKADKNT